MAQLKNILKELVISDQVGANYSSINVAVSAGDSLKTYNVKSAVAITADITFSPGSTLIISTQGSISGAFTLTGDNTVLCFDGDKSSIGTDVIFAGTWICDVVKPELWGAVSDGVTDDYTPILKAANFCKLTKSKKFQFNPSTYVCNNTIDISGLTIIGNNANIVMASGILFFATGSIGSFYNLSGNAYKGDSWLKCTDATLLASLAGGDIVKVISNEIIQPASNENTRAGEMHEVRSVDAGNGYIYFNDYLFYSYATADIARVAKVIPSQLSVRDISVKITSTTDDAHVGFFIRGIKNLLLDNVSVKSYYACIALHDCYEALLRVKTFESDRSGMGYGISIGGATMYTNIEGVFVGARHCITTGNGGLSTGGDLGGISWETKVHDSIGIAGLTSCTPFDTHASSGSIHYDNCTAIGGVFRDKIALITDWDNSTTFAVNALVRSTLKNLYKAVSGNTGKNPDTDILGNWVGNWGHDSQAGFKAEGLNEYYNNCKTFGCVTGLNITGTDAQNVVINNFETIDCSISVISTTAAYFRNVFINGITATSKTSGTAIYLMGKFDSWSFRNIHTKNMSIFGSPISTAIQPERLLIENFSAEFEDAKATTGHAVRMIIATIKQIELRNGELKNINPLIVVDIAGGPDIELVSINNVYCDKPTADVIRLDHTVTNCMINGLQVKNPTGENYFVSFKKSTSALSISNSSYIGTNATKLIFTTGAESLSYILHNCNLFPNMTTFRTGTGALTATIITDGSLGAAGKVTT